MVTTGLVRYIKMPVVVQFASYAQITLSLENLAHETKEYPSGRSKTLMSKEFAGTGDELQKIIY